MTRQSPPRIAAVVLNYRTADDTIAAVQSLQASSRAPDEILVVDNGSGDGSEERLPATLPGITVIQTGRNLGYSGGNNAGIMEALARGADFVFIANSDVIVAPDCIARLETALMADEGLGLAGPAILSRTNPPGIDSVGISFSAATGRMRHPGHGRPWPTRPIPPIQVVDGLMGCAVLVKRTVFEKAGLLAEEYFFGLEDLDFCLRARAHGFASACVGGATVLHTGSGAMGRGTPARAYYGVRNHLLLASRAFGSQRLPARCLRATAIVGFSLVHAMRQADMPRMSALRHVLRGVVDHLAGRYGAGPVVMSPCHRSVETD